ncbi:chromosome segregation protein SMC [Hazenella sp. IB182357]|uniref:Chromosome partition protein Smc n=1 Tax=Polycladospora coralii TaxID=2771432 RepID=A0A926RTJ0_9BACL|nr:chromosome segregation protein SMC [Polycladospora coralii]MBD1371417.1 chromosome segregation protein SMC [Polycladospora coralii]
MYLKRLDMSGFKSFADRTQMEFVPGITAVVGPNGSGKSNVTDGIRWVLGEQSAKSLRGSKMEDVIFAGSESRKPVGYCEVAMTFDNSEHKLPLDYTEVTVTRRVYRSGDSEYLLNKQTCRLRDIHELFMDTGIGKDAYSMIGQGKIDEILSSKSEDRRAIFEEAAGIVKYKTRKKEAEKKLEGTEQNLTRIRDLIHELHTQLEPLAAQAEQAKAYKALKTELAEIEVRLYVHKIKSLHNDWQISKLEMTQLKETQSVLGADISKQEADLVILKENRRENEEKWEQLQAELLQVSEQLEKVEGKKDVREERIRNHAATEEQLKERLIELEERYHKRVTEQGRLSQLLQQKEAELKHAELQLGEALRSLSLNSEEANEQLAKLHAQRNQDGQLLTELRSEHTYLIEQLEELQSRLNALDSKEETWVTEQREKQAERDQVLKQREQLEHERQQVALQLRALEQERQQLEQEDGPLKRAYQQIEKKIHQLRTEQEWLKGMEAEHQGFFQGVKEILRARDQHVSSLQGVHGAVAQIIQVPHQYEAAIETALGGALQHVVVDDAYTGRQGIAFLKEKKLGRATFLPLDVMRARVMSQTDRHILQQQQGVIGTGADLVSYDAQYRELIHYLLGLVIITETLAQANAVAKQLQYRYRIVTLDGDIVNPGGSMSGGSRQGNKTNLLGRSRQIEELDKKIEEQKQQLAECGNRVDQLQHNRKILDEKRELIRKQGEERRVSEQALISRDRELAHLLQLTHDNQENLKAERTALAHKLQSIKEKRQQVKEEMTRIVEQNDSLNDEIEQVQHLVQKEIDDRAEVNEQVTEWKVKVAALNQENTHLKERHLQVMTECEQTEKQLSHSQMEKRDLGETLTENHVEIEKLTMEIDHLRQGKAEVQARVAQVKSIREQQLSEQELQEKAVRNKQATMRQLEAKMHEQQIQANRQDVELNHLLQKLAEEYELSYERAAAQYEPPEDVKVAEKQVRSLKAQMGRLGDVNLGAVEEYERLYERHQFLEAQENDLTESKQKLADIITKMEAEMGKRFLEAFERIRSEFQVVFVEMFGGGKADLNLEDPDHLLETGIEIVAQPPGKKLQNLTLLSGGERALAALALLFSVLHMKPVPFCVLDEVDAALDEANLTRYTRYMQKFAHNTQFIIITHRKHTMEGADVLYGVTMQESGVSKLVSVNLEEYDQKQEVAAALE